MAELVAKRGYRNTAISRICSAAGIARNTFYEHFPDKEAVLAALVEEEPGVHTVILTSENLAAHPAAPSLFRNLAQHFVGRGDIEQIRARVRNLIGHRKLDVYDILIARQHQARIPGFTRAANWWVTRAV